MTPAGQSAAVRVAFYVYFSLLCALTANALLLLVWLQLGGSVAGMPPAGWLVGLVLVLVLVVAARDHLSTPISLRKWISLCLIATVVGVGSAIVAFSATFCVVCV